MFKLLELIHQYDCRNDCRDRIGNRHTDPDSQRTEEAGKDNQTRNQKQHLPGK